MISPTKNRQRNSIAGNSSAALDLLALDPASHAELGAYNILDTPPERAFDDVVALAATLCYTPVSAISLIDEHRQWFKAEVGIGLSETPVEHSFCRHAIANGPELFEVCDATTDPRFSTNPLVTGHPGVRYYAGVPLLSREGHGLGALCVIDTVAHPDGINERQRQSLKTLAVQVTAQLELRRTIVERDTLMMKERVAADKLRWLANHDPLTKLANRTLFQKKLEAAIAKGGKRRTTLLALDVDHFKRVNDTLGHDAGDELLKAIAERLSGVVRATDLVARLGGDEFAIILRGISKQQDIARVTSDIFERLHEPVTWRDREIQPRITIGAAVFPDHAADAAELARHADIALYAAKARGRGRAALFEPDMLAATWQHAAMIDRARSALSTGKIVPFYQPKVDLATGVIKGFEALLRVRMPDGNVASPACIDAAFEDPELAMALGKTMLRQVVADMRCWIDTGIDFGRIAINASACEFRMDEFAEFVLETLREAAIPAARLELEVTETVLLDRHGESVERALVALETAGVRIALDDFGTGYASLSHLQRFPIHALKIDRLFVQRDLDAKGRRVIVDAILSLADKLGIETIAEGIETMEEASYVRARGCRLGQGYLFGHAAAAVDLPSLLQQRWHPDGGIVDGHLQSVRIAHAA